MNIIQISVFMKIRPVGAELFNTDGQDRTKSVVVFRCSANAPVTLTADLICRSVCPITAIFGNTVESRLSETSIIRNVKYLNPHFLRSTFKQQKISDNLTQ